MTSELNSTNIIDQVQSAFDDRPEYLKRSPGKTVDTFKKEWSKMDAAEKKIIKRNVGIAGMGMAITGVIVSGWLGVNIIMEKFNERQQVTNHEEGRQAEVVTAPPFPETNPYIVQNLDGANNNTITTEDGTIITIDGNQISVDYEDRPDRTYSPVREDLNPNSACAGYNLMLSDFIEGNYDRAATVAVNTEPSAPSMNQDAEELGLIAAELSNSPHLDMLRILASDDYDSSVGEIPQLCGQE
jgi:hypothetical protein